MQSVYTGSDVPRRTLEQSREVCSDAADQVYYVLDTPVRHVRSYLVRFTNSVVRGFQLCVMRLR